VYAAQIALALFFLLTAAATVVLGAFVLGRDPGNRIHQIFFLSSLGSGLWDFTEFMQRIAISATDAGFWLILESVWAVDIALFLHFVLLYTKSPLLRGPRAVLHTAILYLPAAAVTLADHFYGLYSGPVLTEYWGYTYAVADASIGTALMEIWTAICLLYALHLCVRYLRQTGPGAERRRNLLVTYGVAVPVVFGIIAVFLESIYAIAAFILPTVGSFGSFCLIGFAIWRYGLFAINPETTARTIVSTMNDGLVLIDRESNVVYANAAATAMVGYAGTDLSGCSALQVFFNKNESQSLPSEIRRKGSVADHETALTAKDGRSLPVSFSGAAIYNDGGEFAGIVGIFRDITERKMAESALIESNKKLALLGSITRHDLLNLVMVLRGYLSIASEDTKDPGLLASLDRCVAAADLIQQQVEFTRDYQEIGVKTPVWQRISDIVEAQASLFPHRSVAIRALTNGAEVYADPLFGKVVYNLIDNALHHGGEKLTAITFSVLQMEGEARLLCEDDGNGISAEEKQHLFQWGFGRNHGHGLYLSREILSITGIELVETGVPGEGARFEMYVPEGRIRVSRGDAAA